MKTQIPAVLLALSAMARQSDAATGGLHSQLRDSAGIRIVDNARPPPVPASVGGSIPSRRSRRHPARVRHLLWTTAFALLLGLPALSLAAREPATALPPPPPTRVSLNPTVHPDAPGEGSSAPLWTVFDAKGRALGFVETPKGWRILEIGTDYLLGRVEGELRVDFVQVWALDRSGR